MTYDLFLGDCTYSSWSMRAWLMFDRFGLSARMHDVDFADPAGVAAQLAAVSPARTVPTLRLEDGTVVSESIAIGEELASRHPEAGLWPADPALRAMARNLTAEMHAGFGPLREHCPMNLSTAYRDVPVPDAVAKDLRRLEDIWSRALAASGGPWLCGTYSIADAFYAPIAARIAGYGLAVDKTAQTYVSAHLEDLAFRRWRAMGLAHGKALEWYNRPYDQTPWPGPEPVSAQSITSGKPENANCPYSGKAPDHLAEIDGRVFGFCNAKCRDKTVADPAAWPAFMAVYQT